MLQNKVHRRVLVIKHGALGDIVQALDAFVIGNDSGPMFLAAQTGVPSLMIMGLIPIQPCRLQSGQRQAGFKARLFLKSVLLPRLVRLSRLV